MSNNNNSDSLRLTDQEKRLLSQWASEPVPGESRLSTLAPPPLNPSSKTSTFWYRWAQAAAAIALFCGGYYTGARQVAPPTSPEIVENSASQPVASAPSSAVASAVSEETCPEPVIRQGADGRFRIETTLCQTGSRATWVINPKLELAQIQEPKKDAAQ